MRTIKMRLLPKRSGKSPRLVLSAGIPRAKRSTLNVKPTNWRIWLSGFFITVAFASCGQKPAAIAQAPSKKNVLVTNVRTMDVPVQIHEFGRIVSPETVNVQPQVSGRITEVHFVEGQGAKKGDLLFVIDPRPFQANLAQS